MPIDISRERDGLVLLSESRSLFPSRPLLSKETVRRYARDGFRGIKLEVVRLPGGRFTSKQAVLRFLKKVAITEANR